MRGIFAKQTFYATEGEIQEQLTTKVSNQSKLLKCHSLFYFSTQLDRVHNTISFCK